MRRQSSVVLVALAFGGLGACSPEPQEIADRVAPRLPQALYAVLTMLEDDGACGFSRPGIEADGSLTGEVGQGGNRVDLVDNCQVATSRRTIYEGCAEEEGAITVEGRIVATGSRTKKGTVGEGATITPSFPSHSSYDLSIKVFDLIVEDPNTDSVLNLTRGAIRFDAEPRFADDDTGCAVMAPHVFFDDIRWTEGGVRIETGSDVVEADVAFSSLKAQLGTGPDGENFVQGSMVMFATEATIGSEDEPVAIVEEYDEDAVDGRIGCVENIVTPVQYDCAP